MTAIATMMIMSPLVERLGWTLVHSIWQVTIIVLIAAIALRTFRNASVNHRYIGLCLALFVVAVIPLITFALSPISLQEGSRGSSRTDIGARASANAELMDSAQLGQKAVTDPGPGSVMNPEPRAVEPDRTSGSALAWIHQRIDAAIPWMVPIWVAGVVLVSLWHLVGWIMARRLKSLRTQPVPPAIQSLFDDLLERMRIRSTIQLFESTMVAVPVVIGWIKPVVLIPCSMLSGLTVNQVEAILAHELAHVRRHDVLINMLQCLVETCLFYHPAVWWLSRQIRIEREFCADEAALRVCCDRHAYAQALVSLLDGTVVPRHAVAATGGVLSARIHRILGLPDGRMPAGRHASWVISLSLSLAIVGGLLASRTTGVHAANRSNDRLSIKEAANRLASLLEDWKIVELDDLPNVVVKDFRGYRLVMRRTWKESVNKNVQQLASPRVKDEGPFEERHVDWEFVLIPDEPKAPPESLKNQIPWRKSNSKFYTRDMCLGSGFGYVWFTRGTIYEQDYVREHLKLEGGDDRIQLMVDGLQIKDEGTMTANTCYFSCPKFGDRLLPYVDKAVEQRKPGTDTRRVIGCLGLIQTERATERLLELFDSKNEDVHRAAQYALIQQPYRKAAKQAYFEMLRNRSSVEGASAACVEFGWKDAVPVLREIIAVPQELGMLRLTIPACRTLEDRPIAPELLDAETSIRISAGQPGDPDGKQKAEAARRLLIRSTDDEAANLAALSMTVSFQKGGAEAVRLAGIEILKSRPRDSTMAFLKSIAAGVRDEERPRIETILREVENAAIRDER